MGVWLIVDGIYPPTINHSALTWLNRPKNIVRSFLSHLQEYISLMYRNKNLKAFTMIHYQPSPAKPNLADKKF
jgi:hypothetical protein